MLVCYCRDGWSWSNSVELLEMSDFRPTAQSINHTVLTYSQWHFTVIVNTYKALYHCLRCSDEKCL